MIVCMASGNGSNFEAIVKSGIKIDLVITNRSTARVIERAKKLETEMSKNNLVKCTMITKKKLELGFF